MLLLRSRSRLLDTQMYPQPFCEYNNIVPHWRTSGRAQFVEVRPVSAVPPRAERIQGYAEPLGYLFLVDEFRESHLYLCPLKALNSAPFLPLVPTCGVNAGCGRSEEHTSE